MRERNDGTGESNILQNQFTAYLLTAIRRRKVQYLRSKIRLQQSEMSLEIQEPLKGFVTEPDMTLTLPVIEQIEDVKLQSALKLAQKRNLHIFLAKTLEDRSLAEIAGELGIGYNTVAAVYYRMIQKIKKEMEGENK